MARRLMALVAVGIQVLGTLAIVVLLVGAFALWQAGALTHDKIQGYLRIARGEEPPPPPIEQVEATIRDQYEQMTQRERSLGLSEQSLEIREADLKRREEELVRRSDALAGERHAWEETRARFQEFVGRALDQQRARQLDEIVERIASIRNTRTAAEVLFLEYDAQTIAQALLLSSPQRAQRLIEAIHRMIGQLRDTVEAGTATPEQLERFYGVPRGGPDYQREPWPTKYAEILRLMEAGVPLPGTTATTSGAGG